MGREAERLAVELARIPSVNSRWRREPGDRLVAEYIEGWLKAQGLRVERQNLTPRRFNVLATLGEGRPHLLLTSHMDTVADVGLEVP